MNFEKGKNSPKIPPEFIHYFKVSAAVAIIRSKPEGLSAEDYAQKLQDSYYNQQQGQDEKISLLEDEILHLKQQVWQRKILDARPIEEPHISSDSDTVFPTPPCSSPDALTTEASSDQASSSSLQQHAAFLSSILSLKTLASSPLMQDQMFEKDVQSTLRKSLAEVKLVLLDNASRPSFSCTVMQHTIDAIVKVSLTFQDNKALMKEICALCQDIKDHIIQEDWFQKVDTNHAESLCHYLLTLSSPPVLMKGLLTKLVKCIGNFSDTLRHIKAKELSLEPHTFENIGYIFSLLQQGLKQCQQKRIVLTEDLVADIRSHLDDSLLHISEDFPLFSHNVWHIAAILDGMS